jgi:hypothetical protein
VVAPCGLPRGVIIICRVPGRLRSIQFGIAVARSLPCWLHHICGSNDGTGTSSGHPSTFTAASRPQVRIGSSSLAFRVPYFDTTLTERPASRGGDAGQYGHCTDHPKEMIGTDGAPGSWRQWGDATAFDLGRRAYCRVDRPRPGRRGAANRKSPGFLSAVRM